MHHISRWILASFEQWRYVLLALLRLPYWGARRALGREGNWSTSILSRWGYVPVGSGTESNKSAIWINALSGGEATQLVSFCRLLHSEVPDARIVVSVGSGGIADFVRRNVPEVDEVFDTPWDIGWVCRRALKRVAPRIVVFVENVYSPFLAKNARSFGAQTVLVSGLVDESFAPHPIYRRAFRLGFYDHIDSFLVKSESDSQALAKLRPASTVATTVAGDMKYDIEFLRIDEAALSAMNESLALSGRKGALIVAGSTHEGEGPVVLEAVARLKQRGLSPTLIIAPRYAATFNEVRESALHLGLSLTLRSQIEVGTSVPSDIILVDTFGELARMYALADVAILGGTLFRRWKVGFGQNIIEPIMARKPVMFGPHMSQFRGIANHLKNVWSGLEVHDSDQVYDSLARLLDDDGLYSLVVRAEEDLISENQMNIKRQADHVASRYHNGASS